MPSMLALPSCAYVILVGGGRAFVLSVWLMSVNTSRACPFRVNKARSRRVYLAGFMYNTNMRECEEFTRSFPPGQPVQAPLPPPRAPGLDALYSLCRQIYPEQINPLTVTAIVKYW